MKFHIYRTKIQYTVYISHIFLADNLNLLIPQNTTPLINYMTAHTFINWVIYVCEYGWYLTVAMVIEYIHSLGLLTPLWTPVRDDDAWYGVFSCNVYEKSYKTCSTLNRICLSFFPLLKHLYKANHYIGCNESDVCVFFFSRRNNTKRWCQILTSMHVGIHTTNLL